MKVGVVKVQNTTASQATSSTSQTTTITTTSNNNNNNNNTTNASGTTTQVLPKLEIPASTTIQIQSSNQSMANTAQVCIDSMPLADVDVRKIYANSHSFLSMFFFLLRFSRFFFFLLKNYFLCVVAVISVFKFFTFIFQFYEFTNLTNF